MSNGNNIERGSLSTKTREENDEIASNVGYRERGTKRDSEGNLRSTSAALRLP